MNAFFLNRAIKFFVAISIALSLQMLGGCAGNQVREAEESVESADVEKEVDPYEGFNRGMYKFNTAVDDYVAEPVTNAYKSITPEFVQTGVDNFFKNLSNVTVVVNDILQGKIKQTAQDTGRFALNSTVGILGFFDVARHVGLEQHDEDFDQTLAVWGVPEGPYLVLPFLGPTTVRGVPGSAVDMLTNPVNYTGIPLSLPVQTLSVVNTRANAEGALKFIDEASLDPYVFTRESFLQWRRHLATDGSDEGSYDVMVDLEEEFEEDLFEDEADESLSEEGSDNQGGDVSADMEKDSEEQTPQDEAVRRFDSINDAEKKPETKEGENKGLILVPDESALSRGKFGRQENYN
ncbi:MAG: MlaA family lipoprotein [Gammaproteobacteria bacterium]